MNKAIFPAFQKEWQAKTGRRVEFVSSFAGSGTVRIKSLWVCPLIWRCSRLNWTRCSLPTPTSFPAIPVAIPTVVVGTSCCSSGGPSGYWAGDRAAGAAADVHPVGVLLAHLFVTFPYMLGAVKPLAGCAGDHV